jgi:hypothetical protein
MIQVRDVFQVKFGKIDQAVALFSRLREGSPSYRAGQLHYNLLTDISGPMFTLIMEFLAESQAAWEKLNQEFLGSPEFPDWFREFPLLIEDGRREFYNVEGQYSGWSPGATVVREAYRMREWQIRQGVDLVKRYGALMVDSQVGRNPRILTDASGPMFRAVIEIETDDLADWEQHRRTMFRRPEFEVWFVQLTALARMGAHEFFRVEE